MKKGNRQVIRAALWLHDEYVKRARDEGIRALSGLEAAVRPYLDQAIRSEQLLQKALGCAFGEAVRRLTCRYIQAQDCVARALDAHLAQAKRQVLPAPRIGTLIAELIACEDEFGAIEVCRREGRVSVRTGPMVLGGVSLGRFRIDLVPTDIPALDSFWVEALDPNPSASNEDVTHPHVRGNHLCTGDGSVAVQAALASGRISEFFVLIRSILQTYNPDSPYVALDEWDGRPCHDCGFTTNDESAYWCEACEETYCDECVRLCEVCDTTLCRGCLHRSEISDVWVCESCASQCDGCSRWCTTDEMTDGLCQSCHETQDDEETSHETDSETETPPRQTQPATVAGE